MVGELHAVSVGMGLQTSTWKTHTFQIKPRSDAIWGGHNIRAEAFGYFTLEVFATDEAGVDVDVRERDGA